MGGERQEAEKGWGGGKERLGWGGGKERLSHSCDGMKYVLATSPCLHVVSCVWSSCEDRGVFSCLSLGIVLRDCLHLCMVGLGQAHVHVCVRACVRVLKEAVVSL